jgi:hypothetical protein
MKALKVIGTVLGVLVGLIAVGVLAFWFFLLRAPSPEEQCDHVLELMKKESGAALTPKFRDECIRMAQPPEFGRMPYAKRAKCRASAATLAEAKACDKAD